MRSTISEELSAAQRMPRRYPAPSAFGRFISKGFSWLPSEGEYREITSCSNYRDYSARRLGTRVKGPSGSRFVHTLNGTAVAVSRMLVFLFEHYQQADGSFEVPEVSDEVQMELSHVDREIARMRPTIEKLQHDAPCRLQHAQQHLQESQHKLQQRTEKFRHEAAGDWIEI